MRYAQIRETDVTNGQGFGISLFVQGCHFHCSECFNQSTWDFNDGELFTSATKELILSLIEQKKEYLSFFSVLGGEPLAPENRMEVAKLLVAIHKTYPNLTLNLWTGYTLEALLNMNDNNISTILSLVDTIVDGRYEKDKRDITLKLRGSSNQRILKRGVDF